MTRSFVVLVGAMFFSLVPMAAISDPEIPDSAAPLTTEEIKKALEGRTFSFVVYDAEKSLTGTSTWDMERGIVYGEYVWDNQSPKEWERAWYVENNKNCTQSSNKQPECQIIYMDGEKIVEVTDNGEVHAVSTPVK